MNALLIIALVAAAPTAPAAKQPANPFLKERFGDGFAIAQLYAEPFSKLSPEDKAIAWHLTLAADSGEGIAYDQIGWNLVSLKRLLEGVYLFGLEGKSGPNGFDAKFTTYLRKFYGSSGNHDWTTSQKFVPEFSADQLQAAALRAFKNGAPLGVKDEAALKSQLEELRPTIFDPSFEPFTTSKSPPPGKDLLTASANTAYGKDVTLKDLEGFTEKYPLDSRVVKVDGKLVEQVFRAGTSDKKVPPGLYADELSRVNANLANAAKLAKADQRDALTRLQRYFQTGEPADWDQYNIAWLKANPVVDQEIGFIESYVDARGQKGLWEGMVDIQDKSPLMDLLSSKVQYFEDRLPWPDAYKRKAAPKPVAKAILMVTGHTQPPAGVNLPNEQPIREKYGSKSVSLTNVIDAAAAVKRLPMALEVARTPEQKEAAQKYAITARSWLVAFHEVLGHASGQVDPAKVQGDPSKYLKEYDNTLEEARADLVALWHAHDPALAEASPDHEQIADQMFHDFLGEGLTDLHKVEKGDSLEEDHQRGHHMTCSFLIEKGAAKQVVEKGKTYWEPVSREKMQAAIGELLTMLMTFKATGDYAGIKALVEKYGIKFDPKLRDEIVKRVKAIDVPKTAFLVSPRLQPVLDDKGALVDVKISHGQDLVAQHLERSLLGSLSPDEATKVAAKLDGSVESIRKAFKEQAARAAPVPSR